MDNFNLVSVTLFGLFLLACGVDLLGDSAYVAGVFIFLFGVGLLLYFWMNITPNKKVYPAAPKGRIIEDYFSKCILFFFNDDEIKILKDGFLKGYERGLKADDLDAVDYEFDSLHRIYTENPIRDAGFNLGFVYAMDGFVQNHKIVLIGPDNKKRIDLLDDCECDSHDIIRDDYLGETHNHEAYFCLNCGGFYIK